MPSRRVVAVVRVGVLIVVGVVAAVWTDRLPCHCAPQVMHTTKIKQQLKDYEKQQKMLRAAKKSGASTKQVRSRPTHNHHA